MLEMLPYPSGQLHMGHVLNYTMGDVVTHFRRRTGHEVLRPMGFDSFGLPAENAAIREGGNPLEITERNIATITKQMRRMAGRSTGSARSLARADVLPLDAVALPQVPRHGLAIARRRRSTGARTTRPCRERARRRRRCWRCGAIVEARNMAQWFFKITAYADQLLDDLATIDWPDRTKKIQTNWIGRSDGAEVLFRVDELDIDIPVFTTRPDTLFGATFSSSRLSRRSSTSSSTAPRRRTRFALMPASPRPARPRSASSVRRPACSPGLRDESRQRRAHPDLGRDYVLMEYGTGAIMAVPAHDERDAEFAATFALRSSP